jgi:hypothetical protein
LYIQHATNSRSPVIYNELVRNVIDVKHYT